MGNWLLLRNGIDPNLSNVKLKVLFAALMSLFPFVSSGLEVGDAVPKLKGKNHLGKEVPLEASSGHQWLLIFTYPKALTGG